MDDGSGTDLDLVGARRLAGGRVDDEVDFAVLDHVEHVRAAFSELEEKLNLDPILLQNLRCATGGTQLEAEFAKPLRDRHDELLVGVAHAYKNPAFLRQRGRSGHLRFGVSHAPILADTHHFARRSHLGTQKDVLTGKLVNGKTDSFTQ